ncbi:hypothetical protein DPMN_160632 [Dreissena polymorpha]|uniref:Uncharacterized protein n=1 Tax=Dreissena polymorpha TaxID=45954 RepID=A0A9D4ENV3_DREPO|nr:hypothetical protein DPMN_160632 [Dreissena polymorpha]
MPDDDVLCHFSVVEKTREFKRVGDLRHHVKNKHPVEMANAPKVLFSSRICFIFSVNPLKYVQIHDADENLSPEVKYARYLMEIWSTGRKPGIEDQLSKWEEALKILRPPKRKATDSLFLLAIIFTEERAYDDTVCSKQPLTRPVLFSYGVYSAQLLSMESNPSKSNLLR